MVLFVSGVVRLWAKQAENDKMAGYLVELAKSENFNTNTPEFKAMASKTGMEFLVGIANPISKVNDSIEDNNRLYVRELYNMELNADMAVLSACETGLGELKRGEGIIGLARAFTYAGAKSTINSLWSVDDAKTKKIMELFYTNIKDGMAKDEALHKAKLTYLEDDFDAAGERADPVPRMRASRATHHKHRSWELTIVPPV